MTYVPDMTEIFPEMGEPEEEREYTVNAWMPVMVQVSVYGTNEDDAIEEARRKVEENDYKIVDRDTSALEDFEIE